VTDGGTGGRRAVIVGAGVVGLSVAWFLQERGYEVTVLDRSAVGAGASSGNAGWICPGLTAPLPEPSVLAYGLRSLARRDAPLRIPPTASLATWRFLAGFALCCTARRWAAGVASYAAINAIAHESYDILAAGGVAARVHPDPLIAAFERPGEAVSLRREVEVLASHGQEVAAVELSEAELHAAQPILSDRARYGLRLEGQRHLRPAEYTQSLAASVSARGGRIEAGTAVLAVGSRPGAAGVRLRTARSVLDADVAVLANGAWLQRLARQAGVRLRIASGRGYSFTVPSEELLETPLYLPAVRVACTPGSEQAPGRLRLAGTMEFRPPDHRLDERRVQAIVRSCRPYLMTVDWSSVDGEWVGPRPVTTDGLPVIGATRLENVFVAGGHGMWGMTLGPATGRLLAERIALGRLPDALLPFDPLR
jgi:D-amino-acid dehydrogenase